VADKRAVREFTVDGDPWAKVESWAPSQGYAVAEQGDEHRRYSKGTGFWTGMRNVDLSHSGGRMRLEAWCQATLAARILSLFILPAEITIESGGFKAVLPRKLGREEVNPLLEALGQPPIE